MRVCAKCSKPTPIKRNGKPGTCDCSVVAKREGSQRWAEANREWFAAYRESNRQAIRASQAAYRASHKEKIKGYDHLRRSRVRVGAIEKVSPQTVYERDGWVCQLCKDPVDAILMYPHPYSKSVDHIKPLSIGGSHALANVQLAHLRCNLKKHNRLQNEEVGNGVE